MKEKYVVPGVPSAVLDGAALLVPLVFIRFTRVFGFAFAASRVGVGLDGVELVVVALDLSPVRLALDAILVEDRLDEPEQINKLL